MAFWSVAPRLTATGPRVGQPEPLFCSLTLFSVREGARQRLSETFYFDVNDPQFNKVPGTKPLDQAREALFSCEPAEDIFLYLCVEKTLQGDLGTVGDIYGKVAIPLPAAPVGGGVGWDSSSLSVSSPTIRVPDGGGYKGGREAARGGTGCPSTSGAPENALGLVCPSRL